MSFNAFAKNFIVKKLLTKMKKKQEKNPGIKLDSEKSTPKEAEKLQDLARLIAQRKYDTEDNPAVKRLKERFKRI